VFLVLVSYGKIYVFSDGFQPLSQHNPSHSITGHTATAASYTQLHAPITTSASLHASTPKQ
jgi:hypothetical protein